MKTVYADVVILVNFCADFMLLLLCSRFLHIKASFARLIFASLAGAMYGLTAAVLPRIGSLFLPAMLVMCFIAFDRRSPRTYVKILVVTFVFSLLLAGLTELAAASLIDKGGMLLGMGLILLCIAGLYFLLSFVQRLLHTQIYAPTVNARIYSSGIRLDTVLLADSGNLLASPVSRKKVIVLDSKHRQLFSDDEAELMYFKTVSGNGIIELYNAELILVNNIKTDACIGFCISGAYSFDGYDGIIPSVLVQNF